MPILKISIIALVIVVAGYAIFAFTSQPKSPSVKAPVQTQKTAEKAAEKTPQPQKAVDNSDQAIESDLSAIDSQIKAADAEALSINPNIQ